MKATMFHTMMLAAAFAGILSAAAISDEVSPLAADNQAAAKSPVSGSCALSVTPGQNNSGTVACAFTGAVGVNEVPAGKNLVIEDVSGQCFKHTNDPLDVLMLITPYYVKEIPMTVTSTVNGVQRLGGSLPVRAYAPAGTKIQASVYFRQNVANVMVGCGIQFTGHYVKK